MWKLAAVGGGVLAAAGLAYASRSRPQRPETSYATARLKVLVLGGGFGGFTVAKSLAPRLPDGASVLVLDRHDFLTFWPMVPEVIPGSIEVQHALRPLRPELAAAGATFLRAEVQGVDLERRVVTTSAGELPYDKLVIASGWRTGFFGVKGAREHALTVDSISDAVRIRDAVIDRLEAAASAADEGRAPAPEALAFAVIGGGSTGVEVAANVRDLLDELMPSYPALAGATPSVHLLQAGDDVLPHLDPSLRRVAAARLRSVRVEVRTDAKVKEIERGAVLLSDGSRIPAAATVWAAGVQPSPLAKRVAGAKTDSKGRLQVDANLRLEGREGVYALGDIAAVRSDGKPAPPTAQAAVQEAATVASNLEAELSGLPLTPFRYHYLGQLVDLGGRFAVSQVAGRKVSGLAAQLLWRAVYLYKLGNAGDRLRVAADWALDAIAGRRVTRLPLA